MIGYTGKGPTDTGTRVRVIVLWSPVTDVTTLVPDQANVNEAHANVHDFLDCDLTDCAGRKKEASPVTYLDSSDPPTMIANSTDEQIPLTQATELAGRLKDIDVPHQLYVVAGTNHGARLKNQTPKDSGQTIWDLSIAFLRQWIETAGSAPSTSPGPIGSVEASPTPDAGGGGLFLIVAGVGVVVVLGLIGVPLIRRRRLN
jgi:acetyl esterase/lipase